MKEEWVEVVGYEGFYSVSNLGRVKSLEREVKNFDNGKTISYRTIKERLKSLSTMPSGYKTVILSKNQKNKRFLVHRLVMLSFVGKSELCVNHKNGVKSDNKLENLEYCTHAENNEHAKLNGLSKSFGENHYSTKLKNEEVVSISKSNKAPKELAVMYNVDIKVIKQIINGKNFSRITGIKYVSNKNK